MKSIIDLFMAESLLIPSIVRALGTKMSCVCLPVGMAGNRASSRTATQNVTIAKTQKLCEIKWQL